MASDKGYLTYILEQLSELEDITYRPMMGEYLIYCGGKLIGGIFDDRFLVKPVAAARLRMPGAPEEIPYPGAKPMLLVENVDDRSFLAELIPAIADAL